MRNPLRAFKVGLVLLALPALGACGDAAGGVRGISAPSSTSAQLQATVLVPALTAAGTQLPVTVRLQNTGAEQVAVSLRSDGQRPLVGIDVVGADGVTVWQSLPATQALPNTFMAFTLPGGTFLDLPVAWDMRTSTGAIAPPGTYTVRARVLAQPSDIIATQRAFTIMP